MHSTPTSATAAVSTPRCVDSPDLVWVTRNEVYVNAAGRRFRVAGTEARGFALSELSTSMMERGRPVVIGHAFDRVRRVCDAIALIEGVIARGDRLARDRREAWLIDRPRSRGTRFTRTAIAHSA